jgi:hypothetical protein
LLFFIAADSSGQQRHSPRFRSLGCSAGQTRVYLVAARRDLQGLGDLAKSLRENIPSPAGILPNVDREIRRTSSRH